MRWLPVTCVISGLYPAFKSFQYKLTFPGRLRQMHSWEQMRCQCAIILSHGRRRRRHHWVGSVSSAAEERNDSVDQQGKNDKRQHDEDEGKVHRVHVDGGIAVFPQRAAEDDAASADARLVAHDDIPKK